MKKLRSILLASVLMLCARILHGEVQEGEVGDGPNLNLPSQLASMPQSGDSLSLAPSTPLFAGFTPGSSPPLNLGSFNIVINAGPTLAANAPALAAFQQAANKWMAYFSDPITVTVNADMGTFGNPNIIGSTSSVMLQAGYDTIRDQLVADATGQPNNGIVASLPTAAQFTATVPSGFSLSGNLTATKASLKAAGFTGLDASFGTADGTMTFNSAFNFDYDRSNGVGAGQTDFETVATHEIGHLLGFVSRVDSVDGASPGPISPGTLDLYRFLNSPNDPSDAATFTATARSLVPGADAIFDDTVTEYFMSTGANQGDGRQASHWKDDSLTGLLIGVMDPTLSAGIFEDISVADVRALDLIGYDLVPAPEPSTLVLVSFGLIGLAVVYRRKTTFQGK